MRRRLGIWISLAIVLLIVGAAIYLEGQRRQSLERVAAELGFRFNGGQRRLPESIDRFGFYDPKRVLAALARRSTTAWRWRPWMSLLTRGGRLQERSGWS